MCSNEENPKFIGLDIQMQMKKIVYLQEYRNMKRQNQNIFYKNNKTLNNLGNINNMNTCCSFYVPEFEIKYINNNDIINQKKCIFNSLPENDNNPFLSYAKYNDLSKRQIIDLKDIKNIEEPNSFLLDDSISMYK